MCCGYADADKGCAPWGDLERMCVSGSFTQVGSQVPPRPVSHSPSSKGKGEKIRYKEKTLHINRGQIAKSSSSQLGRVVHDNIFTQSTSFLLTQPNLWRLARYV